MCTDDDALDHIEKELGISISMDGLRSPIDQIQMDLLRVLLKAENTGCTHTKNMLKYPDNYNIRVEVIQMFLKIFFRTLWDHSNALSEKLMLDGLVGKHEEKAFVEVRSNDACQRRNLAPLISPRRKVAITQQQLSDKEVQYEPHTKEEFLSIFVNHIDAVSTKRRVFIPITKSGNR